MRPFMVGSCPSRNPRSVSVNASHQYKQEYIWFRGGDANGF